MFNIIHSKILWTELSCHEFPPGNLSFSRVGISLVLDKDLCHWPSSQQPLPPEFWDDRHVPPFLAPGILSAMGGGGGGHHAQTA